MDSSIAALVTGAGGGIGRAIAVRLAKAGYNVAVADVKEGGIRQTADLIKAAGREALAITADMSRTEDVEAMVVKTVAVFGRLDILVNNAGVSSAGFIEQVTDDELIRVYGVNLFGVLRATRAAAPYLRKSGRGRVINISSVEGIRGSGLLPVYSSTKAAVIGLTRANAIELARYGVTVNAICPGPIQTDMLAPLIADEPSRLKFIKGVPMHRLGVPEDIAGAVAFLASEESSFITGNAIVIDGGMTIKSL
ncbi:MAG: SDR family NAD(P)-dependent oxidoreductase [Smithellaceae bacterium]|nr:SDR family NAD(P)-dependent oxidoreductase [Smithellaceae bacterium]